MRKYLLLSYNFRVGGSLTFPQFFFLINRAFEEIFIQPFLFILLDYLKIKIRDLKFPVAPSPFKAKKLMVF